MSRLRSCARIRCAPLGALLCLLAFATEPAFAQPASSEEQNRADAAAVSAQFEAGVDQIAESLGGDARYQNMSLDARKNLVEWDKDYAQKLLDEIVKGT